MSFFRPRVQYKRVPTPDHSNFDESELNTLSTDRLLSTAAEQIAGTTKQSQGKSSLLWRLMKPALMFLVCLSTFLIGLYYPLKLEKACVELSTAHCTLWPASCPYLA